MSLVEDLSLQRACMGHSEAFDRSSAFERPHDEGEHLLVFEGGGFTYLSVPSLVSDAVEEAGKLCFLDHQIRQWDTLSDMCCLREAGHVHAHVHHGEITEDVLLEQCMEEAGCTLPMPWDLGGVLTPLSNGDEHESDHEHQDGCGHNRIAHGDHYDWLIPLKDGSYVLSHAQMTANGGSQFIEHGRLVKVGKSLGQLKRRPKQLVDLFTYEGPNKGYEILPSEEEITSVIDNDVVAIVKSPSDACMVYSPKHDEMVKLTIPRGFKSPGMTKTLFDVMGICCPSETPLVKKILEPLPGVEEVLVNPTAKTVTVLHDPTIVADVQLVKLLNEARLDASIHQRGKQRITYKWPSPWTIGSGILLLVSFLQYVWPSLKWVALASVAVGLPPIVVRTLVAMRRFVLDINALMLIAVAGAVALGDYVEAGSIAFLFTLADWLESKSSDKARDAISNVADLAPQTAVVMDGQRVAVEDVAVGTLLAVKAGELIPIDGEVVSGKSSIDESNITGESKPVEKIIGAVVWAGTMNLSGYISVKTTALAEDSAVSRMVRLVEEAQNQHSPTEQLVERVAKYYTPLVVVAAILIAVVPLAAGSHNRRHWFYLALEMLVVACPCALVISTPVTTTCGIAQAARSGLLVRGGSYLEALARVKVVAMDKTGTLTEGHFRVIDVQPVDATFSIRQILYWIACVETKSSHPLAAAMVAYARLHGVEPTGDITDFEIIPGLGVSATVDGNHVKIGNARLSADFIAFEDANSEIVEKWSSLGATVGWVGVNGRNVGVFGVADSLRPEALQAVASLRNLGMKVVMLTGDSVAAAEAVHSQIGDIEVHAALLPEDKVRLLKELKGPGVTAMVGDGINDAPALALADIGIAMGVAGSAVAMETADVALMTNDLRKLAVAITLGRNVKTKIIQNVTISFLTKITIIIIAAVGYPILWAAVVADVGTCLMVILNSMRLLHRKKGVVLPKFESRQHVQKHRNQNHVFDHHYGLSKNGQSHHYHEQEICKIGDNHHQQLGKIRDDHHSDQVDHDTADSHDHCVPNENRHSHKGQISCWPWHYQHHHDGHHHLEHGTTGDHDLPMTSHHHHSVGKGSCWPRHHNGHAHGRKDDEEVQAMCSDQLLTNHQPSKGWTKFKQNVATSLSGPTSRSRKCCTKSATGNKCSDSRINLDQSCCSSTTHDIGARTAFGPTMESTNCSMRTSTDNACCVDLSLASDDKKCCTIPRLDGNSCSRMNQKAEPKKCCSNSDAKMQVPGQPDSLDNSKCCTIPGPDGNFASRVHQKAQPRKCCSNSDTKAGRLWQADPLQNSKCSTIPGPDENSSSRVNQKGHPKKCCSKLDTKADLSGQPDPLESSKGCTIAGPDGNSSSRLNQKAQLKNCSSNLDTETDVPGQPDPLENKKCCTIAGPDSISRVNQMPKKCCSSSDTKLGVPGQLNNVDTKKCCTLAGLDRNSCSRVDQSAQAKKHCSLLEREMEVLTGQGNCSGNKKCCSKVDTSLEVCIGQQDQHLRSLQGIQHNHEKHEKSFMSFGSHKEVYEEETGGCPAVCCQPGTSETQSHITCRMSGIPECCLRDLSQLPVENDGCPESGTSSNVPVHQVHDLVHPYGKEGMTETSVGCGIPKCPLADHTNCAAEALVHSPMRDLTSFTFPVSPL